MAIDVLLTGGSTVAAAEAARVTRQTVSGWRNHHPAFRAEMGRWRSDLQAERDEMIRRLDGEALDAIGERLASEDIGDRYQAARDWLRLRRLGSIELLTGPTTVEAAIRDRARMPMADLLLTSDYEPKERTLDRLAEELEKIET